MATDPGLRWKLRKAIWNAILRFKYRGNRPAHIPVPPTGREKIGTLPLAALHPEIPIADVLVADRVPADEQSVAKVLFYKLQLGLYRLYPAMQPGLPPVSPDPMAALAEAYGPKHRALFPAPIRPPEIDAPGGADLAGLAVKGPFACYLERLPDGRYHWDFRILDNYEHHDGLRRLGTRVFFEVDAAQGALKVTQIDSELGPRRPGDQDWRLACDIALCAASTHLSLIRHFNWVHLCLGAPLAIATRNNLPATHPLCRFLWPHIYGTQYSNDLVTQGQMVEGGDFADTFSLTHRGMCRLFYDTYTKYRISTIDPRADALWRGILDAPFAAPSQDNLQKLFDVMHRHARRCVEACYANDAALREDAAIAAWLDELGRLIPNGLDGALPTPLAREGLARLIASFIYLASVQHEVLGTGMWNYQLWTDRIPVRVYRDGRREPLDVYQRLVNANFNLNVHRTQLLEDFSYLALDERGAALFREFRRELMELDATMRAEPAAVWRITPGILEANINA